MGSEVPNNDYMNFDEFKALLKNKYKNILPKDVFDSLKSSTRLLKPFNIPAIHIFSMHVLTES
jgi:hypothetical protein